MLLGASILIGFFTTPYLIRHLGEEVFGAVRAMTDCYGYLALLDMGLESSVMTMMVRAVSRKDNAKEVSQVVSAATRASVGVASVSIVGGLILIIFIPDIVPISKNLALNLRIAAGLATASYLFQPLSVLRNLCEARQESFMINVFLIGQCVLIAGLSLLFAHLNFSIAGQILSGLLGLGFFYTLIIWKVLLRDQAVPIKAFFRKPDDDAWKRLWSMNWSNFALNICGRVSLMSDNVIIGFLIGPAAVVPFYITSRLAQICQRVLQNIGNASWAALGNVHAQGDHEKFSKSLIDLTATVAIIGVACLVPVALCNKEFVTLWVGQTHFYGTYTTIIAAASALIIALVSLWGWVFLATGRINDLLPVTGIQTVLNLVFSILFTRWFGVVGTILATATAQAITSMWWLPRLIGKIYGTRVRDLSMAWIKPLLVGAPYCFVARWLLSYIEINSWPKILACMITSGAGYLLVAYGLVLAPDERRTWKTRVTKFINRRGATPMDDV